VRAIVFNDTSRFHHGCAAVMRTLFRELEAAGIEVVESVYGNTWRLNRTMPIFRPESFEAADLVVINGEGTMHDDSRMAMYLLDEVAARRGGRRLALVNSLWNRMSPRGADIVAGADLVTVREPLSHGELGLAAAVTMPDLSFYEVPVYRRLEPQGLLKGTFYGSAFREFALDGGIDVMREDWSTTVTRLRHAGAVLTGKHHEVLAACVARCPFVTPEIATHKIAGLGAFIGETLPTVAADSGLPTIRDALERAAADADGLFGRLFNRLEALRAEHRLRDLFARLR
jgi:hypothetical protein